MKSTHPLPYYAVKITQSFMPILSAQRRNEETKTTNALPLLARIKNSIKGKTMDNIKLVRTSIEDYDLYNRLKQNSYRSQLSLNTSETLGLGNETVKTHETLSFLVGKYKNKISNWQKDKHVFMDAYDFEEPIEVCHVITITNAKQTTMEIRWLKNPEVIRTDWHSNFNLDSVPEMLKEAKPNKQTPWQKRGITEEEYKKRQAISRLEEIQEQRPEAFNKLLELLESGQLEKLNFLGHSA